MELTVISPDSSKKFSIEWIEVETPNGSFVVQPGHAPTILMLAPNKKVHFKRTKTKQESVTVSKGLLEITRTHATLILNESPWNAKK